LVIKIEKKLKNRLLSPKVQNILVIHMMRLGKRKIQESSGAYFINVPILWAKNLGIKKGTSLEFLWSDDGSLILRPLKRRARQ